MATGAILYELPMEVANICRCYICQAYLSCGPVKIENGNSICGRCEASSTAVVHVTFENIMANFTFPCRYDSLGCKERLLFNTSMAHEVKCPHRTVPCPALLHNDCNLNVPISVLHSHFVKFHSDLITKDGTFKINLDEDKHCNLIMMVDNVIVVIKYRYDSVIKCLHLEVASALVTEELIYYKTQIVGDLAEGMNFHLNFSEKQCTAYETHTVSNTNSVQIEIEKYLTLLSNPSSVTFKIFSVTAVKSKVSSSKNEIVVSSSFVRHLGEEFEKESSSLLGDLRENICIICKKLSFPIYYSTNQPLEKYCKKCRTQHDGTYVQYSNPQYNQNCVYPCIFKGCSYSCIATDLDKHVEICECRTYLCPVGGCNDLFRFNEIHKNIQHLKDHATYFPNPGEITIDLYDIKPVTKMYFTNIGNILVLLKSKVSNDDSWILTSDLPAGVTLNIFFTHGHCRLSTKPMKFDGTKELWLTKSQISPLPCYAEFFRLTAVISIEKKV
ncbi:hypothetical protein PPYR_13747 [Photinus pyralis]|uniref:SIAH-type domain-containing protein n=1 Tax=Photinus pyralis TaxID=7054 RepID=A0A1Y1L7V6_PHOPY|nr:uncharacterized protein LOC116177984 [Photinus pyralis]XP_031353048.1 uncharacterized protein LOC116177984 [Photinus pyralis]XP_031353049.1 uncharacterized protein LOC116177984 [Photinus pyralis]KAB0794127.1 hypothetical protein PPYR_13747 [Photinus pyralis]